MSDFFLVFSLIDVILSLSLLQPTFFKLLNNKLSFSYVTICCLIPDLLHGVVYFETSPVSGQFFSMLQHAVTPNSVGSLVAWQQEDRVHVSTVEENPRLNDDDSILLEAYRGF